MLQISFFILLLSIGIFAGVMLLEPRTLWSGVLFFWMLLCDAAFLFLAVSEYANWLSEHDAVLGILIVLLILTMFFVVAFPGILIILMLIKGIQVIWHEGAKPANLLSVLFALLLFAFFVFWPAVQNWIKGPLSAAGYGIVSFIAVYLLSLMAMYVLAAVLNLIHLRKSRNADYIVVLGAGLMGKRVTPLLASRIDRGIELLRYNPNAVLILSGGQGPGEDMTESEAMAAYAVDHGVDVQKIVMEQKSTSTQENLLYSRTLMEHENPKIIIVTTAYHVFRALVLARQQGIKCVGFGAKTKWYFTLNALIREFIGYLYLTRKRHFIVIATVACVVVTIKMIT